MGCNQEPGINFVVAHSHEARPIIDYYQLAKDMRHTGFNLYKNQQTRLIISGQGRMNAAAATAYLGGTCALNAVSGLWVNVGVAGHADYSIGSLWRANKITDEFSGRSNYPLALNGTNRNHRQIDGCALMTVDLPTSSYAQRCLYDMEAAGFFQTALRFATVETIASFKVVSDNIENPPGEIDKRSMANLVNSQIGVIAEYLHRLKDIININKKKQIIDIKRIKLTYSQQQIVNDLITCLDIHKSDYTGIVSQSKDARQLIDSLSDKLKRIELLP